jgi:tight adherence protein B
MTPTIAVAAAAALAIVVIALGIAMSGSGSGISTRLERYAAGKDDTKAKASGGQGPLSDLIASSVALANLNRVVEQRDFGANLAREIARADLHLKVSEYLGIWAGTTIGVPVLFFLLSFFLKPLGNPIALLIGALVGFLLPRFWLGRRKSGRLNSFNKQLPDTITLLANSLRAGSSFPQGMELVTRESGPPLATEFDRVIREMSLGMSLTGALNNLVRRVASEDLELMVTAIVIQTQVGGNLATVLDAIAFTIRERVRITGEIQTLTAMQRYSGYVLMLLPVALGGILFLISPSYMGRMLDKPPEMLGLPLGAFFFAVGGLSMFGGYMLIRRIIDIKV